VSLPLATPAARLARPVAPALAAPLGAIRAALPLVLAGLSVAVTVGVLYAGPVYRAAAAAELGWSLTTLVGSFAFGYLVAMPTPVLAGRAVDRRGPRVVMLVGVLLGAAGLLGAAFVREPWQWYLTTGVLLAVAYYTVHPAATALAAGAGRRGTRLGLVVGVGCGAGLMGGPAVAQVLVDAVGWRTGFVALSVLLAAVALAWLPVRPDAAPHRPPAEAAPAAPAAPNRPAGAPAAPAPWLLPLLFAGNALIAVFDEVVYQLAYPYALSLGLTGAGAAALMAAMSGGFTLGMVGGGILSDRVGRPRVLLLAAGAIVAALSGLALATPAGLWPWTILFGTGLGATITGRSALWADLFAGPSLGRNLGILTAGYPIGAAATTLGGAAWLDGGGSFAALFATGGAAALLWAGIVVAATRPAGGSPPGTEDRSGDARPDHAGDRRRATGAYRGPLDRDLSEPDASGSRAVHFYGWTMRC
jgi:MFS family permease